MNDEQLYNLLLDYYQTIQSGNSTWSEVSEKLAESYDIDKTGNALRKWFHRRYTGEVSIQEDELVVVNVSTDENDMTLEEVIWSRSNLNSDEWILDKFWGSLDKPQASFKRRQVSTENVLEIIRQKLAKSWNTPRKSNIKGSYLFVPCLFDAHIGKANLDKVYSEDYFLDVLDDLLQSALLRGDVGRILFPLGQDYAHIDNYQYNTTGGTPQEVNSHYTEVVANQVSIAVKAVEYLAQVYPVDVVMVPGNHDRYSNSWLGHVVEQRFSGHPNVTVDNTNAFRKYYQWGNLLLANLHGDQENLNNIGNIISTEARSLWGNTEYCEVLTGHIHTRKDTFVMTTERSGIMIRTFPSLSGTDTWHNLKAFTKNGRGGMGLVYSDKWGIQDSYFSALEKFL